jgi:2-polyprenyl-3-methyl-5-hydroxy-6-metoxy-1,4-benzoquinol methylase
MTVPVIYLLPEYRPGHGIGHFARATTVAAALGARACIYLPPELEPPRRRALAALAEQRGVGESVCGQLPPAGGGARARAGGAAGPVFLVVDRRTVGGDEIRDLRRRGIVVGIDAGGSGREECDYLVDMLPRTDASMVNVRDMRLLDLPRTPFAGEPRATRGVLVTFGGDDPGGITARAVSALLRSATLDAGQVDVLLPQLAADEIYLPDGVRVLRGPVDLRVMMGRYGVVVTSFGLTALEAAAAGAGVVLVNASAYHERLARLAGFRSAGRASSRRHSLARGIRRRLADGGNAAAVRERLAGAEEVSLGGLIEDLSVPTVTVCPACGGADGPVLARFSRRTYRRCTGCGMIYLLSFEPPRDYPEDYFFEEYRRQYGRTYLEDAPHIEAMGRQRLARIAAAAAGGGPGAGGGAPAGRGRLVDLGCAYGPFLSAAADAGYEPVGVDTSEAAVRYVADTLGFEAHHVSLEALAGTDELPGSLSEGSAAVVTMWYVIEHIAELEGVLKLVRRLLPAGGVFAFSTPSAAGISARRSLETFLERSPGDHLTVWTPEVARRVLSRYGLTVVETRITGHHPERFPGGRRLRPDGFAFRMLGWVSRVRGLGDTFEVYAVRNDG